MKNTLKCSQFYEWSLLWWERCKKTYHFHQNHYNSVLNTALVQIQIYKYFFQSKNLIKSSQLISFFNCRWRSIPSSHPGWWGPWGCSCCRWPAARAALCRPALPNIFSPAVCTRWSISSHKNGCLQLIYGVRAKFSAVSVRGSDCYHGEHTQGNGLCQGLNP